VTLSEARNDIRLKLVEYLVVMWPIFTLDYSTVNSHAHTSGRKACSQLLYLNLFYGTTLEIPVAY
jgi:hypothetical protein